MSVSATDGGRNALADVAIFACGLLVDKALAAAQQLAADGVDAAVVNHIVAAATESVRSAVQRL